jgi:hypothetical protein
MPDMIRKVEYFTIFVSHKPAEAFRVLSTLVSADVNLLACSGVPRGRRAQIDVVPEDAQRFKSAVKKAKLEFKPQKSGFLIQGKDRPGALTDYLRGLGEKNVNVTGIDALSAGEGRWGAIIWVDVDAVRKAGALLRTKAAEEARPKPAKKTRSSGRARK